MDLTNDDSSMLREVASYVSRRSDNASVGLAARLNRVIESGRIERGDFTTADINYAQVQIAKHESLSQVLEEINAGGLILSDASGEAAGSRIHAARMKEFQLFLRQALI